MSVEKEGEWAKAIQILDKAQASMGKAIKSAIRKEGEFLRAKMVTGIREQAPGGQPFVPLSPNTLRVRRVEAFAGTKALIRTGELRNAITVVSTDDGVFVGVLRTARNRDGQSLANVADIHENGRGPFLVPITLKSRHFLGAAGVQAPGPGKFVIIKIPARPFVRPVFEKFGTTEQVRARVLERLREMPGLKDFGGLL